MVEVGGKPILWHIMKLYAHFGLKDFVLCLGYNGWKIKEYFLNFHAMTRDFTGETPSDDPTRTHHEVNTRRGEPRNETARQRQSRATPRDTVEGGA